MENKAHFGSLTPRMQEYRESVLDQKPYIDAQRAVLATESYKKNLNQPAVMKRALMLQNILAKMDIYIEDETVLVGNQSSVNRGAPVFPEYTMKFILDELDLFEKRDGDVFYITEETKRQLREIAPFWENNNLRSRGEALIPEEMQVYMDTGFFGMEGKLNAGDAHLAVDYGNMLKVGLKGYEDRARKLKAELDLTEPESIDKYQFYKAVLIVIDAVKGFAERFAALAREKAAAAEEPRRSELLEIARVCDKVPYQPAETFHEAVQAVWFIQLILQIESNGHSLSYGRFDQYVYPIGGQTADGKDAVNKLSFLILRSIGQTRLPQPNLTVRYHRNINQAFMDEALEVLKLGTGMPAFNNDEVIIPSFIEKGVKKEDAYCYSAIGCVETAVPGKWGYRCTGMSYLNFPRILLMPDGHEQRHRRDQRQEICEGLRELPGYGIF